MKSIASGVALGLALASCHSNKPAQSAESSEGTTPSSKSANAAEPDQSGSSALDGPAGGTPSTPRSDKASIDDDTEKKDAPCSGASITDLLASLSQASCEVAPNAPAPPEAPTKDTLEVRINADSTIAPGGAAKVTVVFRNKSKGDLPLDFTVDPDPHFAFELSTPKGVRVDKPAGNEPSLPSEAADNEAVEPHTARVTLASNGTATAVLPWQAVKYKWASPEKAKGALAGHGYPREPAGPLPKGKYTLRVITPLVHIEEGSEHELSQPHVSIEVTGSPASDSAAATPSGSSKKGSKAPTAAPTSAKKKH